MTYSDRLETYNRQYHALVMRIGKARAKAEQSGKTLAFTCLRNLERQLAEHRLNRPAEAA